MKILSMSGFVPEQICDTVRFTQFSGDRNIDHYCGYASDYISEVLQDDSIDGAVYPKSCDSTRIISSYLSNSGKFLHQIRVASSHTEGAIEYFAKEIRNYQKAVETYYSISINDVKERSSIINERNEAIRTTYLQLADLSFSDYLRSIHSMLKKPLTDQKWNLQEGRNRSSEKKVFLVGSFLSNVSIIDMIEQAGLSIVGDTLPESGRLISRKPVDISGDLYKEIAQSILTAKISPTRNSFATIIREDFKEIEKKKVRGIIFLTQKYCEPYDFLFSVYKAEADARKIPIIRIPMNHTEDDGRASLILEALADIV